MLKLLSNAAVFAGSRGITPVGTEKANNPFWLLAIGDQCGPGAASPVRRNVRRVEEDPSALSCCSMILSSQTLQWSVRHALRVGCRRTLR
jgi:hypothetical protein